MAIKTEILEIDGARYKVSQLPIEEGLELYDELLRMLGGGILAVASAGSGSAESAFLAAFVRALGNMPPGMLAKLGHLFQKHTKVFMQTGDQVLEVEMNAGVYQAQFAGRLGHWSRWVLACLKLNFADFLPSSPPAGSQPAGAATPTT